MLLVYFDLDGVLFDLDLEYNLRFGHSARKADGSVFWPKVKTVPDFFRNLPLMPGAMDLWNAVPPERRRILSAVARSIPECATQKREAVHTHFDIPDEHIHLVEGREKKKEFCRPGDFLIDDREDNIEEWVEAGGTGLLYTPARHSVLVEYLGRLMA